MVPVFVLQVMSKNTGKYEMVRAPPGGVVVNIGEVMQFWTSDRLVANVSETLVLVRAMSD